MGTRILTPKMKPGRTKRQPGEWPPPPPRPEHPATPRQQQPAAQPTPQPSQRQQQQQPQQQQHQQQFRLPLQPQQVATKVTSTATPNVGTPHPQAGAASPTASALGSSTAWERRGRRPISAPASRSGSDSYDMWMPFSDKVPHLQRVGSPTGPGPNYRARDPILEGDATKARGVRRYIEHRVRLETPDLPIRRGQRGKQPPPPDAAGSLCKPEEGPRGRKKTAGPADQRELEVVRCKKFSAYSHLLQRHDLIGLGAGIVHPGAAVLPRPRKTKTVECGAVQNNYVHEGVVTSWSCPEREQHRLRHLSSECPLTGPLDTRARVLGVAHPEGEMGAGAVELGPPPRLNASSKRLNPGRLNESSRGVFEYAFSGGICPGPGKFDDTRERGRSEYERELQTLTSVPVRSQLAEEYQLNRARGRHTSSGVFGDYLYEVKG
eukprot:jgi/Mesvir1/20668/Mv14882-RA.1